MWNCGWFKCQLLVSSKSQTKKAMVRFFNVVFWRAKIFLLIEWSPKDITIIAPRYVDTPMQLHKISKIVGKKLFEYNFHEHIHNIRVYWILKFFLHSPYSSNITSRDDLSFWYLKEITRMKKPRKKLKNGRYKSERIFNGMLFINCPNVGENVSADVATV